MSKTNLRPCPFCGIEQKGDMGLENVRIEGYRKGKRSEWWVCCYSCGAEGGARDTKRQAVEAWNDRPSADINDQIGCLYEIRCLLGDKEGKLMHSEVVDRIKLALFDIGHLEARIILFATHVESLRGGMSLANEMREFVNKRVTARKQRREAAKGEK